jgi:hypothetical protein
MRETPPRLAQRPAKAKREGVMKYVNATLLATAALLCATAAAQTEGAPQTAAEQTSVQRPTACETAGRVSRAIDGVLGLFAPQSRAHSATARAASSADAACAALNAPANEPPVEEPLPSEASPENPADSGNPNGLGGPDTTPQSQ